ncbi:transcription termination factor Rho [Prauserella muralis]|uniref:Transcription termination factor Rho n=1 Tax=Prauserella muralis TaxID=588067 RepID=A0A2V4AL48_9PSEU|nr:transcription termination factor Rho [Prauserella muralis]PXY20972.1 transcription termination factor Rho [Prauserella muralis]TWE30036.1 transcription termination factor Rho [Prauserella muralis]
MSNTDLLSGDVNAQADSPGTGEQAPQTNGAGSAPKRRPGGLSGMVIADLRALATELGVSDTTGMRKGDLIAAIRERQGKNKRAKAAEDGSTLPLEGLTDAKAAQKAPAEQADKPEKPGRAEKAEQTQKAAEAKAPAKQDGESRGDRADRADDDRQSEDGGGRGRRRRGSGRAAGSPDAGSQQRGDDEGGQRGDSSTEQRGDSEQRKQQNGNNSQRGQQGDRGQQGGGSGQDDDERGGRRGRRFRDRRRRGGRGEGGGGGADTEIREDDVLLPVAGILDVLDNYAFVRTSGYLPGQNDVYVSLSLVRKHGLRRGDAITGVVRQPREGEQQRQKFNPLVRVDSVNGLEPEVAKKRPEFHKLTPLYPNERLRLETTPNKLTTRVIDLVMPVGKGQRALIVSPPKAGKTTIMQDIANAITTNNPECHLMVVLVDERPEEVTDMQRSVQGEVIASTFDRPPSDHTSVAELSIERAKRLVEMGHDVVVLLDSITRLGRAYNLAAPASGRILSGGVDSTALFPPKRFLGAARNIEDGGSLTIFATAMVETGSTGDTVIFEEFKGTGNAELKLDRKIAERRVFPAVDVNPSGTRKEELLLSPDELAVTHKLHRVLHALDSQQAIDLLLDRLRKTKTNIEFLMQVSKTAPGSDDD